MTTPESILHAQAGRQCPYFLRDEEREDEPEHESAHNGERSIVAVSLIIR
jgi:hypothetical protein